VGITCGIGSLLTGARAAGFKVLGNVEWRKYYHATDEAGRNTFTENFPGAVFPDNLDDLDHDTIQRLMGAHLAVGHPECGNFSQLSGANKNRMEKVFDPADIPLFVDLVARMKPRFFVMDDLPRSFLAYPMAKYAEKLSEYDLYPEWVSNWGYGNVQKGRNRMFMLGALRAERWAFRPGEEEHGLKVRDCIGDLGSPGRGSNLPNHDPHDNQLDCFRALNLGEYRRKNSWDQVREYFLDKPGGHTLEYPREDGSVVKRIGFLKGHWDGPSHVLTGGNAILHNKRCEPYTVRERARIQGFPDEFIFYGTVLNDRGEWNHDTNMHLVKQTGKAMPVQFAEYVARQVKAHIEKEKFTSSGKRVIPANEHVDEAKRWYCQEVGYSDQQAACSECWLQQRCSIRTEKYGMASLTKVTLLPVVGGPRPARPVRVKQERSERPKAAAGRLPRVLPAVLSAAETTIEEF
jgi:DNA (cytosine-5)-methyltransferase 1